MPFLQNSDVLVLPLTYREGLLIIIHMYERAAQTGFSTAWGHRKCINSVWHGNGSNQDCKALQRVVRLAERIPGSALPSLQDIYFKRCKSRAAKIIKDSNHPDNRLFILLPSGKRFRSMMAKTERLRRSFFPQSIRLLNTNSVS